MKYHKIVNKNKEDIAVNCRISDIIFRLRHPYSFEYLDSLSEYIKRYTDLLDNLAIQVPEELKYRPNTRYRKSSIVVHNSQVFVSIAENGTTIEPSPYSTEWIALTDSYGYKCVAITSNSDNGSVDDMYQPNTYGNLGLQELSDILRNGKYYDYFNDGDYMVVFDKSGNKYTMRMNYREYVNYAGTTNVSVDFVSDELIPTISFDMRDTFGIEDDTVKYLDSLSNVPVHKFSSVSDKLDSFAYGSLPNALLGLLKYKSGFYVGYDRSKRLSNDGVYYHTRDHMNGLYLPDSLGFNKKNYELAQWLWLPTATEVFGAIPYQKPDKHALNVESGFKQLPSLDTAFKRVKHMGGKPKPWMTYTMEDGTKYPCVVNRDGTRVPMEIAMSSGYGLGNQVFVPLCFTMGDIKL